MASPSVFAKLNVLESAILRAEDSAEDARWAQAREVATLLDRGLTQRHVAAEWINGRTDKPYSQNHVKMVAMVWRRFGENLGFRDRPSWTDAYATVKSGSEEVVTTTEAQRAVHEGRAPTSVDTAEKLVQNLGKAPVDVQETVYHGLRQQRADQYVEPVERKARDAAARDVTERAVAPVLGEFGKLELVATLESAVDLLREMVEERSLDPDRLHAIHEALDAFVRELEVADASVGLERA